jgi:hypothetical protein
MQICQNREELLNLPPKSLAFSGKKLNFLTQSKNYVLCSMLYALCLIWFSVLKAWKFWDSVQNYKNPEKVCQRMEKKFKTYKSRSHHKKMRQNPRMYVKT